MDHEGDIVAGSGILISSSKILTCAHVITDMKVNETLFAYGQEVKVLNCIPHDRVDVGIIEITNIDNFDEEQIAFVEPSLLDEVYLMGFPKIPDIREAPLTIQKGEVNNLDSTLFDGWKIFLFSAISRPGNSGGPIISHTGNIIGIVTGELFSKPKEGKRETTLPFYAGIPTSQITEALLELNDEFSLPN